MTPRQHLPYVEAGHDCLAGAGVIGQEEAQPGLGEHVVVDSNVLMRNGIDTRNFGGKGGVEEVPVSQAFTFGNDANHLGISGEVDNRESFRACAPPLLQCHA